MQYAHVITADKPAAFPTRFAALNSLLSAVTSAGVVVQRTAIPGDSGLDALTIFTDDGSGDAFLICRINESTFSIMRTLHR